MQSKTNGKPSTIRDFSELEGPNLLDFLRIFFWNGIRDPLKILTSLKRDFGSTVRVNFPDFGGDVLLLSDPELMEEVLLKRQKHFKKPDTPVSKDVEEIMGGGLLTSDGDKWLRQHRILMPHFQDQSVDSMVPIAVEESQRLLDRWSSNSFEQPFNLFREMKRVGLRFISRALFGYMMNHDEVKDIRESIDTLRSVYRYRRTSLITLPLWIPTPNNRKAHDARDRLYEFADMLIENCRNTKTEDETMLSTMLETCYDDSDTNMTQEEVRTNIVTFIIAGYTTTASAMGWMSFELLQNPDIAKKVRNESTKAWDQNHAETILENIPYTKAAFDETLRLYPTAPWIARANQKELVLGEFRLPAETPVVMTPYLLHHNPEFYDAPKEYQPDRFLGNDSPEPLTYIPFSVGAHQCIGREIALMEGPLIMSKIFCEGNFKKTLATPESASIHTAVNIEPEERIQVLFEFDS